MPPINTNPVPPETPAPEEAAPVQPFSGSEVDPASVDAARGMVDKAVESQSAEIPPVPTAPAEGNLDVPQEPSAPTTERVPPAPGLEQSVPEMPTQPTTETAPAPAPGVPGAETTPPQVAEANRMMDVAAEAARATSKASVQQNTPGNQADYIGLPPQSPKQGSQDAPAAEAPTQSEQQITPPPTA